ncbi:Putative glycosyltransferase (family GT2) (plasmid) [Methylorubrum extorquens DM4]|uniref:Glycosyltransferase (Family GT2) n=1 Tax=Methylorubrum extorquens (strain DSM 6343 / CIP 106787 / DM4) TaxID=661410 RepID=A0A2P9HAX9_METED|nr:glycosyltransferase [Methylorubrum extorquens]SPK02052.1 Putative glycosyltransferase (family GT2) [Methylorubrum extorquens DM4]
MTKSVTLITPCFKTPSYYLERLSLSVLPYADLFEWIIVDDTPGSKQVLSSYEKIRRTMKDAVLIKHDVNRGISSSYKSAIEAASGNYIAILDHDDEINLEGIFDSIKSAIRLEYDLIYTGESRFSGSSMSSYHKPKFDILSALHYFYPHHLCLFKRNVVQDILTKSDNCLSVTETAFDIGLWYEYIRYFENSTLRAFYISAAGYGWRVHHGSTASDIHQKPNHLKERQAIGKRFFSYFEHDFTIQTRDDVPFILSGKFGLDHTAILDYIKRFYRLDFFDGIDQIELGEKHFAMNDSVDILLRSIPFKTLATLAPNLVICVDTNQIELRNSFHYPGVPYLARVVGDEICFGSPYVKLTSKQLTDPSRALENKLVVSSNVWSD